MLTKVGLLPVSLVLQMSSILGLALGGNTNRPSRLLSRMRGSHIPAVGSSLQTLFSIMLSP